MLEFAREWIVIGRLAALVEGVRAKAPLLSFDEIIWTLNDLAVNRHLIVEAGRIVVK